MVDGDHHNTHQIISRNPDAQKYVAERVFSVPALLHPERLFVVRGTEAHVGSGGSSEESLAKSLNAERDEETHTWSRWRLMLEAHGVLMDFQHHGKVGSQPWTRQNVVNANAAKIFYEFASRGRRHPDLAFRSHAHQSADSFEAQPVRLIQTPSFQLKTGYVHKVAPENIADVGGVAALIQPDGRYEIIKRLYEPSLPKVVK
jgi:succinate dehydrogenase flavin-adding protein (antitoxin of CptAB toxin-antitoxin module)